MVQTKIYGLRERLDPIKSELSDVIHSCVFELSTLGIFTTCEKLTISKLIAIAIETKIQLA
ncbi:hypothetical protein NIES4074_64300 (plasmid) [Cylindrospermum sp. NIES-4074]|nr:hypothetical protein NIES4074_64300 [Cylindrospermum sp. NIES-4074]